jgi:hypothetical protein
VVRFAHTIYPYSLDYTTPDVVYQTATGGGAKIVDKFNKPSEALATELSNISES